MGSVPKAYCSYLCTVHPNGTLNSTQTAQRVMPCFTLATMPQSNFVWMCGANAVVIPTDDSFMISTQLTIINKRRKRGLSTKHHLCCRWRPWIIDLVVLLTSPTVTALKDVKLELRALRMMELQHRMVLDQLTASLGGVCVIVGTSCCTFIHANKEDGGIFQAIANLTARWDASLHGPVSGGGIYEWLTGCAW